MQSIGAACGAGGPRSPVHRRQIKYVGKFVSWMATRNPVKVVIYSVGPQAAEQYVITTTINCANKDFASCIVKINNDQAGGDSSCCGRAMGTQVNRTLELPPPPVRFGVPLLVLCEHVVRTRPMSTRRSGATTTGVKRLPA